MSWQSYVENQICNQVTCKYAAIASLNDGSTWGKYELDDYTVNQQQLKAIADAMRGNPEALMEKGIWLGKDKYICLYADNNLVRGRLLGSALCIVATKKCLIVVIAVDNFPPGKLNNVVEKLGDYLRSIDY